MLPASSKRTQKGIGLIETVIAALLLGITVSGSIFIAAELSRSGVNARVRAGALDVSTSSIEAALYAGAGVSDLSSFNTTQGAVSSATYSISTNSSAISSTTYWSFRGGDEQVALSNAYFYESELIGNVASGGSGDLVAQTDSGGDSGGDSGSESGGDGGSGDDSESGSDSGDSGGDDDSDTGADDTEDDQSRNTNWTGTISINVDKGDDLEQSLGVSITPSPGFDSASCSSAGDNDSFTCSVNVLTGTTWAGMLSIDVIGSGNDVICDGDEDSGDDPWQETLGLTQASPSASVTVRHEDRPSRCDTDEAPSVNDSAIAISTSVSNGSASPSQQLAFLGQTATIAITPNTGYEIDSNGISGCNGTASSTSPYTTGTLTEDCTVSAVLAAIEYLVNAVGGSNGTVSPSSQNVAYGGSTSFTVTPDVSHALTGVGSTSGCSAMVDGNDLVVSSVTGACTVTPTYTIKSYDMTAIAGSGIDSVNPASQAVEHGDTGQVSVTVATGYENPVASGCGDGAVSGGQFTSSPLTADCEVTFSASGEVNTVSWNASSSSGVEAPSGLPADVTYPNTFTVPTISALEGYSNVTIYSDCETGNAAEVSAGQSLGISTSCEIYATAEEGIDEWTASITVVVDEDIPWWRWWRKKWSISVPGCSPSSADFYESGDAITFSCTKASTAGSEVFEIIVDGLDYYSGICMAYRQFDQSGWSASVTLTPAQNAYRADLVLEDNRYDCSNSEAPQTEYSYTP